MKNPSQLRKVQFGKRWGYTGGWKFKWRRKEMIREGQLVSHNLSQEEYTGWPHSQKMEVTVRLPVGFSCLDLAVVFLRRGGDVTDCVPVSSLGPAAGAREQLFPLRPLTKGQPVCENRSFPEELMMPMEIVAGMDLNPTMAGFQALFIGKQPIFGHCLCFTFASWIINPVPHSLQTLYAESTPDSANPQRVRFPR